MNATSQFVKYIKRGLIVLALIGIQAFVIITGFTTGSYWAHRKNMHKLWEKQASFNETTTRVIEKLVATSKYNFEFNQTNKALILRIAEIEIPDEVALLHKIPARK